MISNALRGVATALLLTTCGVGAASVAMIAPAEAAVRPAVGKALQAAISLANGGHSDAALAKVREAESVSGLTGAEQQAIAQTKNFIAAKTGNFSGGGGSGTAARAKFAADYNAGRYSAVTGEDVQLLKKFGAYDYDNQIIVAQAYYLSGRLPEAIKLLHDLTGGSHASESALSLMYTVAYKAGDNEAMRSALERLVQDYNKPQYWSNLFQAVEGSRGLKDHQNLDLYRLRLLTGAMKTTDDYETAAELAIEFNSATEAANIVQKGLDAKILSGDHPTKLLNTAKTLAAADAASLPRAIAAAKTAKTGDAAVKCGEDLWGQGRFQDAIDLIQAGIAKGVSDAGNAQIRLGIAYLSAGQKDTAIKAFNAVPKDDANNAMIAHLWAIYAHNSR
jgi:tetratricopeptide (TPR) repeat protein